MESPAVTATPLSARVPNDGSVVIVTALKLSPSSASLKPKSSKINT